MDVAIAVHLLETASNWDAGVLFTGDTDLVAAVWSLRRQGKRIFCSLPGQKKTSPLVQACQSFFPWDLEFLLADFAMFSFLARDGVLDTFRNHELGSGVTQVRGSHEGVTLAPTRSGGAQNLLMELLRGAGLSLLAGSDSGGAVAVEPSRTIAGGEPIVQGHYVLEGLRRHAETFSDAGWYPAYVAGF